MTTEVEAIAAGIAEEIRNDTPGRSLRGTVADVATAYAVQDALRPSLGPVCGRKIAANTPKLLEAFGIEQPICAMIVGPGPLPSGADLPLGAFLELALEPEFIAVVGRDVDGPVTEEDIPQIISHFAAGFEVLDRRRAGSDLHGPTAVSYNIMNAGCVISGDRIAPATLKSDYDARFMLAGEALVDGTNTAPQHPFAAAAFILNHFTSRGEKVSAGEVLLCGAHHLPVTVSAPGRAEFVAAGSAVSLSISA